MTDETNADGLRIAWLRAEPDWHEGETGESYLGGTWDDGTLKDGDPFVPLARLDALTARIAKLEAERDASIEQAKDAMETLNAWFDRRKLAHEAIDEAVLNAARGYLRTSRSGGMDKQTSDMIEGVIADMARLSVFADLFARAALRDGGADG